MKKLLYLFIILILFTSCSQGETQSTEDNKKDLIPITTYKVNKTTIYDSFLSLGKIKPNKSMTVSPEKKGDIENIYISNGENVKKNEALFSIKNKDVKNNYNITKSQLETRKENLEIKLDDSKELYDKNILLFEKGAISKQKLQTSKINYDQIKNEYKDAVVSYNNQINILQNDLKEYTFNSPISGKIAAIYIEEDDDYKGQDALTIIDDKKIIAKVEVTSSQIDLIQKDQNVRIYPDASLKDFVLGKVINFNYIPNENTGLYKVEILINKSLEKFKIGSYIEAEFILNKRKSLAVPKKAIINEQNKKYVFIIKKNKAIKKEIKVGNTKNNLVEVIIGLEENDKIALRGNAYLENNAKVKIINN
ncbi:MAG: efflux RND transporter periplasmic adaptor subunit [Bacillota bacterium]